MQSHSVTQRDPVPVDFSELHELSSRIVNQKYLIKVRLPEGYYTSPVSYPVLYLLDGDYQFAMATDIVQYLIYGDYIPDLIIVSPAYGSKKYPEEGGKNMRIRDLKPFTDQGQFNLSVVNFLQFLEIELMPFIASTYRVNTSDLTLEGYSLGAQFVMFTLFQKPVLFNRLIAVDANYDDFLDMEQAYSESNTSLPVRLFISAGGREKSNIVNKLLGRDYEGLSVDYTHLTALGHFSVGAEGLTKGLCSVYKRPMT